MNLTRESGIRKAWLVRSWDFFFTGWLRFWAGAMNLKRFCLMPSTVVGRCGVGAWDYIRCDLGAETFCLGAGVCADKA